MQSYPYAPLAAEAISQVHEPKPGERTTVNESTDWSTAAVYLHENKVLTINEYKQKFKHIMQIRSYTKSKIIILGPYLQVDIIRVQCILYRLT